jgi:hypothetical protein
MKQRIKQRVAAGGRLSAQCKSFDMELELGNLSADGCLVQLSGTFLRPGDRLTVDFPGHARVKGRVVWRQGFEAGIAFLDDLPAGVVAAFARAPVLVEIERPRVAQNAPRTLAKDAFEPVYGPVSSFA